MKLALFYSANLHLRVGINVIMYMGTKGKWTAVLCLELFNVVAWHGSQEVEETQRKNFDVKDCYMDCDEWKRLWEQKEAFQIKVFYFLNKVCKVD